jgi:ribosomal protein S18 acetylase RimI-like enzyme
MTMATVTVRDARVEDAWEIARVHVRAWQAAYRGIVPDGRLEALSVSRREENWHERLRRGVAGLFTLVAERDRELVGFCTVTEEDGGCEIHSLYVDPGAWRSGAGTAMLYAAMDRLRADGHAEVRQWVFAANRAARAFYGRHGFETDGVSQTRTEEIPEVRLWRSLKAPNDPEARRPASPTDPSDPRTGADGMLPGR